MTAAPLLFDRFADVFGMRRGVNRDESGSETETLHYEVDAARGVETWHRYPGGPRHRDDGPAQIVHLPNGGADECWFCDGALYRADGGPVFVKRRPDGTACEQWWYRDGEFCGPPEDWRRRFWQRRAKPEHRALSAPRLRSA